MNYSDLVPIHTPKSGIYLYDYCMLCKSEQPHFVLMKNVNTIRKTVFYEMICWKCLDDAIDFNQMNHQLGISPVDHAVFWAGYIFSISHWNEWVTNSKVPNELLPLWNPKLPTDDEKKN